MATAELVFDALVAEHPRGGRHTARGRVVPRRSGATRIEYQGLPGSEFDVYLDGERIGRAVADSNGLAAADLRLTQGDRIISWRDASSGIEIERVYLTVRAAGTIASGQAEVLAEVLDRIEACARGLGDEADTEWRRQRIGRMTGLRLLTTSSGLLASGSGDLLAEAERRLRAAYRRRGSSRAARMQALPSLGVRAWSVPEGGRARFVPAVEDFDLPTGRVGDGIIAAARAIGPVEELPGRTFRPQSFTLQSGSVRIVGLSPDDRPVDVTLIGGEATPLLASVSSVTVLSGVPDVEWGLPWFRLVRIGGAPFGAAGGAGFQALIEGFEMLAGGRMRVRVAGGLTGLPVTADEGVVRLPITVQVPRAINIDADRLAGTNVPRVRFIANGLEGMARGADDIPDALDRLLGVPHLVRVTSTTPTPGVTSFPSSGVANVTDIFGRTLSSFSFSSRESFIETINSGRVAARAYPINRVADFLGVETFFEDVGVRSTYGGVDGVTVTGSTVTASVEVAGTDAPVNDMFGLPFATGSAYRLDFLPTGNDEAVVAFDVGTSGSTLATGTSLVTPASVLDIATLTGVAAASPGDPKRWLVVEEGPNIGVHPVRVNAAIHEEWQAGLIFQADGSTPRLWALVEESEGGWRSQRKELYVDLEMAPDAPRPAAGTVISFASGSGAFSVRTSSYASALPGSPNVVYAGSPVRILPPWDARPLSGLELGYVRVEIRSTGTGTLSFTGHLNDDGTPASARVVTVADVRQYGEPLEIERFLTSGPLVVSWTPDTVGQAILSTSFSLRSSRPSTTATGVSLRGSCMGLYTWPGTVDPTREGEEVLDTLGRPAFREALEVRDAADRFDAAWDESTFDGFELAPLAVGDVELIVPTRLTQVSIEAAVGANPLVRHPSAVAGQPPALRRDGRLLDAAQAQVTPGVGFATVPGAGALGSLRVYGVTSVVIGVGALPAGGFRAASGLSLLEVKQAAEDAGLDAELTGNGRDTATTGQFDDLSSQVRWQVIGDALQTTVSGTFTYDSALRAGTEEVDLGADFPSYQWVFLGSGHVRDAIAAQNLPASESFRPTFSGTARLRYPREGVLATSPIVRFNDGITHNALSARWVGRRSIQIDGAIRAGVYTAEYSSAVGVSTPRSQVVWEIAQSGTEGVEGTWVPVEPGEVLPWARYVRVRATVPKMLNLRDVSLDTPSFVRLPFSGSTPGLRL